MPAGAVPSVEGSTGSARYLNGFSDHWPKRLREALIAIEVSSVYARHRSSYYQIHKHVLMSDITHVMDDRYGQAIPTFRITDDDELLGPIDLDDDSRHGLMRSPQSSIGVTPATDGWTSLLEADVLNTDRHP
jgi:hypothetical protein